MGLTLACVRGVACALQEAVAVVAAAVVAAVVVAEREER